MRPRYETETDRNRETDVTNLLIEKNGLNTEKLQESVFKIDFAVVRGSEIIAFCEVKGSSKASDLYPKFMISLDKWIAGITMSKHSGKPFWICVVFTDKKLWVEVDPLGVYEGGWAGRRDTGDPWDMEPCVFIPKYHFKETDAFLSDKPKGSAKPYVPKASTEVKKDPDFPF